MAGPNEREQMDTSLAYLTGLVNQELVRSKNSEQTEQARYHGRSK
jgi:hypothetical protein